MQQHNLRFNIITNDIYLACRREWDLCSLNVIWLLICQRAHPARPWGGTGGSPAPGSDAGLLCLPSLCQGAPWDRNGAPHRVCGSSAGVLGHPKPAPESCSLMSTQLRARRPLLLGSSMGGETYCPAVKWAISLIKRCWGCPEVCAHVGPSRGNGYYYCSY